MRLYCLSGDPNTPCFVLTIQGRSILLDFPLPTDHILDYLPVPTPGCVNRFSSLPKLSFGPNAKDVHLPQQINELRVFNNRLFVHGPIEFYTLDSSQYDFSLIDIILISNYETLLGLPYLFKKYSQLNAQIYLTEPTFRFGQQLMYELVAYVEPQSKMIYASDKWRIDPDLFDAIEHEQRDKQMKFFTYAQKLMPCYSAADVDRCLNHTTIVHFDEQIDLYSSIRATAISSGYCLGTSLLLSRHLSRPTSQAETWAILCVKNITKPGETSCSTDVTFQTLSNSTLGFLMFIENDSSLVWFQYVLKQKTEDRSA